VSEKKVDDRVLDYASRQITLEERSEVVRVSGVILICGALLFALCAMLFARGYRTSADPGDVRFSLTLAVCSAAMGVVGWYLAQKQKTTRKFERTLVMIGAVLQAAVLAMTSVLLVVYWMKWNR
jgi:uncharacterized membrane protein